MGYALSISNLIYVRRLDMRNLPAPFEGFKGLYTVINLIIMNIEYVIAFTRGTLDRFPRGI